MKRSALIGRNADEAREDVGVQRPGRRSRAVVRASRRLMCLRLSSQPSPSLFVSAKADH